MTSFTLPNWLLILMAAHYLIVGVIFVIKFGVDMWYLKTRLQLDRQTQLAEKIAMTANTAFIKATGFNEQKG